MTTTDTAPPITVVPRELTHAEWFAEGMDLFGKDMRNWGFQCPTCGSVATPADFPKGSGDLAPVECLGRHGAEGRCKRAAYGFIPGPWFVKQVDGTVVSCFPFAAPPQAPQSAPREPQATPGPENAPDAPDAAVGPGNGSGAPSDERAVPCEACLTRPAVYDGDLCAPCYNAAVDRELSCDWLPANDDGAEAEA